MADLLLPGQSVLFASIPDGNGDPTDWVRLPHTVKWELSADVEEPTEIRTSDTANRKVAACGGATSYSCAVTSALCDDDWLYAYILDDPNDPTTGLTLWFYVTHVGAVLPSGIENSAVSSLDMNDIRGPVFKGIVQAPGISFDNDASDPTTVEWTINVTAGPYIPCPDAAAYATAPRPLGAITA